MAIEDVAGLEIGMTIRYWKWNRKIPIIPPNLAELPGDTPIQYVWCGPYEDLTIRAINQGHSTSHLASLWFKERGGNLVLRTDTSLDSFGIEVLDDRQDS